MLTVKLFNFRCHREKTFTFSNGLNLIDGSSGQGKTTILEAIHFCLIGKHRNVVSRGEKKCSVTLEFNGMTIQRTKSPNRLTIQPNGLEDDAAQAYIHQLIGGEDFELTSYMLQKGTSQFFTLSSSEKRKFVEALSKRNTDSIDKMKERINSDLKAKKLRLSQEEAVLNLLSKQNIDIPSVDGLEGLIDLHTMSDVDCVSNFVRTIYDTLKHKYTILEEKIKSVTTSILHQSTGMEQLTQVKSKLELLRQQMSEQIQSSSFIKLDEDELKKALVTIELYENNLAYQKKREELQEKKKTYEQLVQQEDTDNKQQISILESKLKSVSEDELKTLKLKLEELDGLQKNIKKKQDLLTKYNKLKKTDTSILEQKKLDLENKKKFVSEMEQRKNILKCPHCTGSLILCQQSIQKAGHNPSTPDDLEKAKQFKKDIPVLQTEIDELFKSNILVEQLESELKQMESIPTQSVEKDYTEVKKKVEELQLTLQQNKMIEAQLKEKKSYNPKDKYTSLRKQFEQGVEQLKLMKKGEPVTEEEWKKSKKIQVDESEKKTKKDQIEQLIIIQKKKIEQTQQELDTITVDEKDYKEELERYSSERTLVKDKLDELDKSSQNVDKYKAYAVKKIEQRKMDKQIEASKKLICMLQNDIMTIETFLRKVSDTENKCVEDTIDLINQKVKTYLDRFFQIEPMNMLLMTEKEAKKGTVKSELNMQITYKDAVCDLTSLSGGEYDRCALAFMLAINELSSSPFLILDESISSLDLGNAENVLDALKDSHPDKFVLLVSHQANTGMFDHVLSV